MKRGLALMLTLVLCLSVTACAKRAEATATQQTAAWQNNRTETRQDNRPETQGRIDEPEEPPTENHTEAPPEPDYQMVKRPIRSFETTFSEGRAWISFCPDPDNKPKETVYGLIDESGYVYLTTDEPGTKVLGGLTVVVRGEGMDIYDLNGNRTYSFTNTADHSISFLAQGEGQIVVLSHETGFSSNAYYLYAIDAYGNEITSKHETDESRLSVSYAGHDIFYARSFLFNASNDNLYSPMLKYPDENGGNGKSLSIYKIIPEYQGVMMLCPTGDDGYLVTPASLESEEAFKAYIPTAAHYVQFDVNLVSEGITIDHWDAQVGGPAYYGICDYVGVSDYYYTPEYPEGVHIPDIGSYSGGYAPLLLRGLDKFLYVTMIDKCGKELYEPVCLGKNLQGLYDHLEITIKLESFARYANGRFYYQAYDFTGEKAYAYIDTDGSVKELPWIDPNWNPLFAADDNYVYFSNCLTDVEGNVVLDSISYPMRQSSSGNNQAGQAQSAGKEYVNPSSFKIEGKWKSVGSYGFGQAQPGAIVSFDGVHCNLYSPADTYAFYKSGESFLLDCTSVLSGTVSFTVKIIDDRHIDLYNGGYVTELSRVD